MSPPDDRDRGTRIRDLPPALPGAADLARTMAGDGPAVFLDYDGTLTPIVEDPDRAELPGRARRALRRLAATCPVAVVSGRDLEDVRRRVGLEGLWYAGSHGFDLLSPDGERWARAEDALPALEAAAGELARRLADVPGARLERKRFGLAVHVRSTPPDRTGEAVEAAEEVAARHAGLRCTRGKQVRELRPDREWDKGRAVIWILRQMPGRGPDAAFPLYVGDDVTDEDAFRALAGDGTTVRVGSPVESTAADYLVPGPGDVPAVFEWFEAVRRGRDEPQA